MAKHDFEGRCHCGNISYVFAASAGLDALGLRACQCSFCRAHGARTTSDPSGTIAIRVADRGRLQLYRFGLGTADFLICRECGVFIGAMMEDAGRRYFTVNASSFRPVPPPGAFESPHDFGAEDAAGRIARRKAKWTPVTEFSS
ncbi:MAG TPA: hypothetical protein VHZ78_07260 [Rhizomicrobium sp.]|jgi:hypothetical protein|nr:hypothetical protein [Rhizomicrobium sp.]